MPEMSASHSNTAGHGWPLKLNVILPSLSGRTLSSLGAGGLGGAVGRCTAGGASSGFAPSPGLDLSPPGLGGSPGLPGTPPGIPGGMPGPPGIPMRTDPSGPFIMTVGPPGAAGAAASDGLDSDCVGAAKAAAGLASSAPSDSPTQAAQTSRHAPRNRTSGLTTTPLLR